MFVYYDLGKHVGSVVKLEGIHEVKVFPRGVRFASGGKESACFFQLKFTVDFNTFYVASYTATTENTVEVVLISNIWLSFPRTV
jgi:hypothetical protein